MAEETQKDDLERSEEATPKRREDARKRGQFPRSRNLIPAATLLVMAVALRYGGEALMMRLGECIVGFFAAAGTVKPLSVEDLFSLGAQAGVLFAPVLLSFFGMVMLAGLGAGFLQTGFVLAEEPLRFDPSRINPLAGFRRIFSFDGAGEFVKALVFIAVLSILGGVYLYSDIAALSSLTAMSAADVVAYASRDGVVLISWVVGAMGVLAGLEYLYQRWRTETHLRMSRQEVKEEMRDQEGDPHLKGRLKSLRQKLSRRRMTAEVAKADVVITNPTHLAVALGYRAGEMSAPRVLGKGAGYMAEKIREIARSKGIPIIENKPLAQLLYRRVEVGWDIPETLYRAVAEVLAYVYRLRRGERGGIPKFSALQG